MATAKEVEEIIHRQLNSRLAIFIRQSWYILISLVLTSAGAWFSLYYQVQNIDAAQREQVAENKESTLENRRQIDMLRTDYKADLKELKEDVKFIRNNI